MLTSLEFRSKYKITSQTLHNWRKTGRVKFKKITDKTFLYFDLDEPTLENKRQNVIYTRV
jgi:predicted site-specific integrase-resolvase